MHRAFHTALIIILNALPIYALLKWDWQVFDLIFLYWLENLVVGVFATLSIVLHPSDTFLGLLKQGFIAAFFSVHYGLFCTLHGLFVFTLFGHYADVFREPASLYAMIWPLLQQNGLLLCAASLLIMHTSGWLLDMQKNYKNPAIAAARMPKSPYQRITVLHITLIASALMLATLHHATMGLILMVVLKTVFDLANHYKAAKADCHIHSHNKSAQNSRY